MILEGDAHGRQAPGVLHFIIERNAVLFHRETTGVRERAGHMRVILANLSLPFRAPLRPIQRHAGQSEPRRIIIEAAIDSTAAVESAFRIGAVIVVQHSRNHYTFVFVQRMLEQSEREPATVEHEVLSDIAIRIPEPLRKRIRFRHQQQPWGFRAIGAYHNRFGPLEDFATIGVEIDGARHSPIFAGFDLANIRLRTNLATARFHGCWNQCRERAGLRAYFASEGFTISAMYAGSSAAVLLRDDSQRRGKRVQAQLLGPTLEQHAGRFHRHRRQRIRLRARSVKWIRSAQTGYSKVPFSLGVVWLEIVVRDRPVAQIGARHRSQHGTLVKILGMETPVIRGEMDRPAAHHATVFDSLLLLRGIGRCFAKRIELFLGIVGEPGAKHDGDFIVLEIFFVTPRSLLQRNHAKSGGSELLRHDAARCSDSDHDEIHFVGGMKLSHAHFEPPRAASAS